MGTHSEVTEAPLKLASVRPEKMFFHGKNFRFNPPDLSAG